MTRWETWLSHVSTAVVSVTGVAYFWMKHLVENDDPFSVVNHPWQPAMVSFHVLAAPVMVFVVGLIVNSHIRRKLAGGARLNRRSGLVSTFSLPVMIASGYLLQVVTGPQTLRIVLVMHLASSAIFLVTYLTHQAGSLRMRRLRANQRQAARLSQRQTVRA